MVAACEGGSAGSSGDDTSGEAAPKSGGVPAMPEAKFAPPTTMIDAAKVAESEGNATPEPQSEPDLAQGEDAYTRLCAECHGDDGEGVADKAETIVGVGVGVDDVAFMDLLRAAATATNTFLARPRSAMTALCRCWRMCVR